MEEALRIIISKSTNATSEAIQCLAAIRAKSPVLQLRYNHCVTLAFNDPEANFSREERALIAEHLGTGADDSRSYTLRIRLTDAERAELTRLAESVGLTMSEYVRKHIFS